MDMEGSSEKNVGGNTEKASSSTEKSVSNSNKELIRPEISDSYGPWMIAKRSERRQNRYQGMKEGKQYGAGNQGSNGKKNMDTLGGSRFEALQENDQEEVNRVEEENIMHEPESSPNNTRGNIQPISSKGKRPSVQVNEKQILNEKAEKYSGQTSNAANTSRGEDRMDVSDLGVGFWIWDFADGLRLDVIYSSLQEGIWLMKGEKELLVMRKVLRWAEGDRLWETLLK
nr:uncharacterized protein LOC109170322 [Ipomoea batatas]